MYTCKPNKLTIPLVIGMLGSHLMPMNIDLGYKAEIIQNLMHIPTFAIITVLLLQFLRSSWPFGWPLFSFSLFVLVLLGITTEVVQAFVPSRWASAQDVFLNIVGISFGTTLFLTLDRFKPSLDSGFVCKGKTAAQSNSIT